MEKEHIEVILEGIQGKFDLVLEGYDTLNRKIDKVAADFVEHREQTAHSLNLLNERIGRVEEKTDALDRKIDAVEARLSHKIDAVAADLASHRADTELHHRGYQVAER